MKTIIQFSVLKEEDGGYSASAVGFPIFTQGDSFEVLEKNIVEAVHCHFDTETIHSSFPILANLQIPQLI